MRNATAALGKKTSEKQLVTKLIVKYEDEELAIENVQLTIEKKLNEHTLARLKGRVKQDNFDQFVLTTNAETNLVIEYQVGEDKILLFNGVIVKIESESEGIEQNAIYYLEIEALSYTYLMDIQHKRRSFQDVNITYYHLIKTVIKEYSGSDCLDYATEKETLNSIVMQYQETDWQFIKRMASRFYAPIIANHTSDSPKFTVGVRPASTVTKLENLNYKVVKNVGAFRNNVHNYRIHSTESDYMFYEVTTKGNDTKSLEIGDSVLYKGRTFYIVSAKAMVKHHILSHIYTLSASNGFFTPPIFNETIAGLTIQGTVIKVSRNLLKVRLDIDPEQSAEKAHWLKYSTFYSTWYCMPEVGDRVNVHFPTKDESDAIVINSIKHASSGSFKQSNDGNSTAAAGSSRGGSSQAGLSIPNAQTPTAQKKQNFDFENLSQNEKVKMIVTPSGKMIILDDNSSSVSIVCNDSTYIRLADSGDISIFTESDITFESKADINFSAEEMIYMKAKESIAFECGESLLELTPEEVKIKGTDIKLNK
ncbi:hypothetical protein [Paenibacillus lautus]|uniref:hypothetical protein n=1 Tax=Paenibacillus lautus TaxID=1401 RepID=UPI003D27051C